MFFKRVFEFAQAKWTGEIVLPSRKKGCIRICVYECALNAVTKRDTYPILRIKENINSLGTFVILSTLDASSRYWKDEIGKKNRGIKAFTAQNEFYRFLQMPFGLPNDPRTFL